MAGADAVCLVMTLIGADHPGLVEAVSRRIREHGGNWRESRMAHLAGQFAGILLVEVPGASADALAASLRELEGQGLHVHFQQEAVSGATPPRRSAVLELVGYDRPGIVHRITAAIAAQGVNIEELTTGVEQAAMSGEDMFRARASLLLSDPSQLPGLRAQLERIGADLMVDISLGDPPGDAPSRG